MSDTNFDSTFKSNVVIENIYSNFTEFKSGQIYNTQITKNKELVKLCITIIQLDLLNKLSDYANDTKKNWINLIQNSQACDSGCFHLEKEVENDVDSSLSLEIDKCHITFFCLQALRALGSKPKYHIVFIDKIDCIDSIKIYLNELEKGNSYKAGEGIKLILFFLIYRFEIQKNEHSALLYYEILDHLDLIQSKDTGLWGNSDNSKKSLIYTAFNLLQFYDYVYRPIKYPTLLIESVLEHITFDSLIINPRKNEPFSDLSSVYLLSSLLKQRNYRVNDLKEILNNSYDCLKELLRSWVGSNTIPDSVDVEILNECDVNLYNNKYYNLLLRSHTIAILEKSIKSYEIQHAWNHGNWPGICHLQNDVLVENSQDTFKAWLNIHKFKALRTEKQDSKTPSISVIIPCYNLGLYLRIAIESVLYQTFNDLEIIVVNDGSTDEFTKFILQNLDYPKTTIVNQENQGLAASRNNGIKMAKGKYICCLDADDSLRPYNFERAYPVLEKDSNIGFVSGYVQVYDEWDQVFGGKDECNFPQLLVNNWVNITALFRKEAWEKVGGYYQGFTTPGIEDWDFWISMLESGYLSYFIPEIFYDYRVRSNSMAREMNDAKHWEKVSRQLVSRHVQTYIDYIEDYVALKSNEWAVLLMGFYERRQALNWWKTQSHKWQNLSDHNNEYINQLKNEAYNPVFILKKLISRIRNNYRNIYK